MSLGFSKIENSELKETISSKSKTRKTLTPKEKLIRRINREFPKKKFIGDILIDDEEYLLLEDLLFDGYKLILNSYSHIIVDPVFATALVQVGIRKYDGNYWKHLKEIFKPYKMNVNHHKWIGESFYSTLKKYNMLSLDKSEIVNNILMHGFVVNNYANEFFDFLFAYYRIDLERDIERNSREMMNSLIEIIMRNDNTDRTYLIRTNTQLAVSNNIHGCKIRIRRFLNLIDKSFWGQDVQLNLNNRMSRLFSEWRESSAFFNEEMQKNNGLGFSRGGKKRFTSPYIKCNFRHTKFNLIFPSQIFRTYNPDSISWKITIGKNQINYIPEVSKVITGYKSGELAITLDSKDLFEFINIELMEDDNRLRIYKINRDIIRFFDKDGDLIVNDRLPEGEVYSFTNDGYTPISDALIDSESIGNLVRSYFDLENGDIIRLPDGTPLSVGKKIDEGLLQRGCLSSVYGVYDSNHYKIYKKSPTILMKITSKKVNGTMIRVNDKRYRMFDINTTVLDLKDRSGEIGYLINLADVGCVEDGFYNIYVDVPNDRTNRSWQFILMNGMNFEFEDSPYIFESKGTIKFNEGLEVKPNCQSIEKVIGENSFNFKILSDKDEIIFEKILGESSIDLHFDIPVFKWSFDNENWFIEQPCEIWHYNFPTKIYFKFPGNRLILHMDDLYDGDEEQSVIYTKNQSLGIFECDVTRFKSWFGREKKIRSIYINLSNRDIEFMRVITRSYVIDKIIMGDYINQQLIGEFDIVGNSKYYVDIIYNGNKIVDKEILKEGKILIDDPLDSGRYKIVVYEEEEDDTGFGDTHYLQIYEFYQDLINPYNLTGKKAELKYLKRHDSLFKVQLKEQYIITDLQFIDYNNKHNYYGILKKPSDNNLVIPIKIKINVLNNLRHIFIYFIEDGEELEFLFDNNNKSIVKEEQNGLRPSVKYRRYTVIYDDEYIYGIEFI